MNGFKNTIDILEYLLDIDDEHLMGEILFWLMLYRKLESLPPEEAIKCFKEQKNKIRMAIKEADQDSEKN